VSGKPVSRNVVCSGGSVFTVVPVAGAVLDEGEFAGFVPHRTMMPMQRKGKPVFRFMVYAYLIGSLPTAYLLTRWFAGRDIRQLGSRNAGTANVVVNVGWLPGILTLLGDMGKGYLAALVGELSSVPLLPFLTPACAIAGHNWPIWLGFHGGGGLATFVGGCLALTSWPVALAGLALWGLLYLLCRDHDKSAVLACILLPCVVLFARESMHTVTFVATSSLAILLRRVQSIKEQARRWRHETPRENQDS